MPDYPRGVSAVGLTAVGAVTQTATEIVRALKGIYDPCCRERDISIVDMGLVRAVEIVGSRAKVELMLTSGWCPFASRVLSEVRDAVEALPGIGGVSVEVTWDEPWTMDRLSESARAKLQFLPHPAGVADRERYIATNSSVRREARGKGGHSR
jgi:metal-sulfur cluster biosynthetic enzyme